MRRVSTLLLLLLFNPAGAQQSYLVDWEAVGGEAIDHLVELVKIPSVNPPGNETEVAEYVRAVLESEGIESRLYALDPSGRLLGVYSLSGASARDWEDMSIGRDPSNGVHYLYAGDIGAGHTVTALYELALTGSAGGLIDPLRYGKASTVFQAAFVR